nr:uncharacterized protein LOC105320755 [Crassostrea gigas]
MDGEISDSSSNITTDDERPIRGRVSNRRRGRGRARGSSGRARGGRGRGRRPVQDFGQPVRAEVALAERDRQMQERIEGLSLDSMRIAILNAYYQQPSFIFRVLEATNHPSNPVNPPSSPIPPSPQDIPSWCRCTHCREMPSEVEKRCCNQIPRNCHSRLLDFQNVVLDPLVLEVAMRYRNDMLAQPQDLDYSRCHRHTAYRQYILWLHGYLGVGNRQVIPSGCVWAIRDRYPDPSGQYVGFVQGRFG